MAISLSDDAAVRIKGHMNAKQGLAGLRFSVKTTGCSGMAYVMDYAKTIADDDHIFESNGVTLIVDDDSLQYVDGTTIGFKKDGLSETFTFDNPMAKAECGCGESFSVK